MAEIPRRRSTDWPTPLNVDDTHAWPDSRLTPLDKVQIAQAEVARAKIHYDAERRTLDAAHRLLDEAIQRLVEAATGGHQ